MTNKISFRITADAGSKYAPEAFNAVIGKTITIQLPDGEATAGVLVAADVIEEGSGVMFTLDCDEAVARLVRPVPPVNMPYPYSVSP